MKKLIAILLCAVLAVTAASGCGKGDSDPSSETSASVNTTETSETVKNEVFQPPEQYASAVLVTINPVVKLYLDEKNVVLAMECVNEDAQTAYSEIEAEIVGANLDTGVKKLIDTASDAGYLEKEKTVTVDIVECKIEENKKTVLAAAGSTVKQTLQEKKIEATIEVKDNGTAVDDATYKEVTMTDGEKQAEADRLAAEQAAKEQAEQEAAQKLADAKNPEKSLKKGTRYICAETSQLPEAEYFFIFITFYDNGEYGYGFGDYSPENLYNDDSPLVYNGKNYYACSGGGGGGNYKVTATNISLLEDDMELALNEKSELVIKRGDAGYLKTGQVFSPMQ